MTRKTSGFTLIELMIVIAIIAIIAAIAIPNLLRSRIAGNEQNAAAGLRTLTVVQAGWRQGDYDANGVKDFWTIDVYGLYGCPTGAGTTRGVIPIDFAKSDSNPDAAAAYVAPGPPAAPVSKQGYFSAALIDDENGDPYVDPGLAAGASGSVATNRNKFGFAAFAEDYDGTGVREFVVNESGTVYGLDTGEDPATAEAAFPGVDPTLVGPPFWAVEGD